MKIMAQPGKVGSQEARMAPSTWAKVHTGTGSLPTTSLQRHALLSPLAKRLAPPPAPASTGRGWRALRRRAWHAAAAAAAFLSPGREWPGWLLGEGEDVLLHRPSAGAPLRLLVPPARFPRGRRLQEERTCGDCQGDYSRERRKAGEVPPRRTYRTLSVSPSLPPPPYLRRVKGFLRWAQGVTTDSEQTLHQGSFCLEASSSKSWCLG